MFTSDAETARQKDRDIRIGDDLVVKRTVLDPEAGWLLVSDSTAKEIWATRPWPEDAQIIGEVK